MADAGAAAVGGDMGKSRPKWAVALVSAIRGIDGGCDGCIGRFLDDAAKAHPGVDWAGLVWNTCKVCGVSLESVHDALCDAHQPPRKPVPANIGQIVASAWDQVISQP